MTLCAHNKQHLQWWSMKATAKIYILWRSLEGAQLSCFVNVVDKHTYLLFPTHPLAILCPTGDFPSLLSLKCSSCCSKMITQLFCDVCKEWKNITKIRNLCFLFRSTLYHEKNCEEITSIFFMLSKALVHKPPKSHEPMINQFSCT